MTSHKTPTLHARKNTRIFPAVCLCLLLIISTAARAFAQPEPGTGYLLESYEHRRRETAEMLESATIWLITLCEDQTMTGSGFVIADGYILTNGHVVDCENPDVYVSNAILPLSEARVVSMVHDPDSYGLDFALLEYAPPKGVRLPALVFNTDLRRMDRVSAWGYPGILASLDEETAGLIAKYGTKAKPFQPPGVVYTEGAVSTFVEDGGAMSIVHTAAIHSGNSGGPLVNRKGEVVGINTWTVKNSEKGVFLNCALLASDIVAFLRSNGIEPKIVSPALAGPGRSGVRKKGDGTGKGRSSKRQGAVAPPSPKVLGDSGERPSGLSAGSEDSRVTDKAALGLLSKAGGGDIEASLQVGLGYLNGEDGFPKDLVRSAHWLKKVGDGGVGAALAIYGVLLIVEPELHDPAQGLELLQKYCMDEDADPAMLALLAQLYLWGETSGVPYNASESLLFAEMAAEKGDADAMGLLAYHYLYGTAVEQDLEKAGKYAKQSAAAGSSIGVGVSASLTYFYVGYKDLAKDVLEPALAAANDDSAAAQGLLAVIYAFDEGAQNLSEAEQWAQAAALNSECQGEFVMSWLHLNGSGVQQSLPLAKAYLELASGKSCLDLHDLDDVGLSDIDERMSAADAARAGEISREWREAWGLK